MERADIAKLWQLEEIAAAGHHELAANLRTAINELVKVRAAPEGRTDLERLESVARALDRDGRLGGDPNATLVRTAIAELRSLRTRPVSCEACNGMAKERDAMFLAINRKINDSIDTFGDDDGALGMIEDEVYRQFKRGAYATSRATDENGGVGA